MNAETFYEQFATFADAPQGIESLRKLILRLAVRGQIVPQDTTEETATDAVRRIEQALSKFLDERIRTRIQALGPVPVDEYPFALPIGWSFVRLASILRVLNGRAYKKTELLSEGTPVLRVGNLFTSDRWYYSDLSLDNEKYCDAGDLIYAWSASFGPFIWPGPKAIFHYHIWKLQPFEEAEVNKEYLRVFLSDATEAIRAAGHGISMLHMTKEKMEQIVVPLPPLAEQRRIVEKVDQLLGLCDELAARQAAQREKRQRLVGATLDHLVSTRNPAEFPTHSHRLRNHFDQLFDTPTTIPQLRQTILQLAVQGQLVPQDPNDEPADTLLANVHQRRRELVAEGTLAAIPKPVPLAEGEVETTIPEHWRWARLNDLVAVMDSGWSPACDEEPTTDESEWGVLKTTAVQTLYFNQGAHKRLPSGLQPRPDAEAKTGDLLITRAGPQNRVGISCLVKAVRPRLMISDKIIRFHLIEPFLFEEFIALCLNAGPSQAHIERAKSGMAASQMNISQAKFRMTPIPVPPLAEQKRIVTKVTELLSLCDALEAKLTQAESVSTQLLSAAVHHLLTA